jgi:thiamine-monophosphate kinase
VSAAAGLAALTSHAATLDPADADVARAVAAWRRPRARIADGLAMVAVAHGAIDVSDGLARDVAHVARASGLSAILDERALEARASQALGALPARLGRPALDLALRGGEDYALLAASPAPIPGFDRIGRFQKLAAPSALVVLETSAGLRPVDPGGWDHFG